MLNSLQKEILNSRYALPTENTWDEVVDRVIRHVIQAEPANKQEDVSKQFHQVMNPMYFVPGGRVLYGAGRVKPQLLNCFHKDTLVFTRNGWCKIVDVQINDEVLTHKGRFCKVTNKLNQGKRDHLYYIKIKGLNGKTILRITGDHKVMTPSGYVQAKDLKEGGLVTTGHISSSFFNSPSHISLHHYVDMNRYSVVGDRIGIPCKQAGKHWYKDGKKRQIGDFRKNHCKNDIDLNIKFARWTGYYLSEGCVSNNGCSLLITFHKKEIDYINEVAQLGKDLFGVNAAIEPSSAGEWTQVKFHSTILCDFHKVYFGRIFSNKRIPEHFYASNSDVQLNLLATLIRGDGSKALKKYTTSYTLTCANPSMIYDAYLIAKLLGFECSYKIHTYKKEKHHSDTATLYIRALKPDYSLINIIEDAHYNMSTSFIQNIVQKEYNDEVWDISVERDHSLVADGVVVSNCFAFRPDDNAASLAKLIHDIYITSVSYGGCGVNYSSIRPRGNALQGVPGVAPGVLSEVRKIDVVGGEVKAGGIARRAALLASLSIYHPDVLEFLQAKLEDGQLPNHNISVIIDNAFIKAVRRKEEWIFKFEGRQYFLWHVHRTGYRKQTNGEYKLNTEKLVITGTDKEDVLARADIHHRLSESDEFKVTTRKRIRADELLNIIAENAHRTGEPGVINESLIKENMATLYFERFASCNPCITAETMVAVADGGGDQTIGELAKVGKDVPVYCLDDNGKVQIRYMRHPRLTGKKVPIYKVTLDNGEIIRTTGNHKLLMKNGKYKRVDELEYGNSLEVISKFDASLKDIFPKCNSRSQNYVWINGGHNSNYSEHRLIYEFYNGVIPKHHVIHHQDYSAQNNNIDNLICMSKFDHDQLHAKDMMGDKNPMRRAKHEWSNEKWEEYRKKQSLANGGIKNGNSSGHTNNEISDYAIKLTKSLNRRFSNKEWRKYAKEHDLPQDLKCKWRSDHLNGGTIGLAKWAATQCGIEFINEDPRVVKTYIDLSKQGYDCIIEDGKVYVLKQCEDCGDPLKIWSHKREQSICQKCAQKRASLTALSNQAYHTRMSGLANRKAKTREKQAKIFSDLAFKLQRAPLKKEWQTVCRAHGISPEVGRKTSPFTTWATLKEAGANYNHKVVSVEFCGYEDVYNGTVDEFHNFFVGGWESKQKNGKRRYSYINNQQCGESILPTLGNCCLGSINLSALYDHKTNDVNWKLLAQTVRAGVRFLDNVLTVNRYPLSTMREVSHNSRRIGLGIMGLAYLLIKMGLRYGSDASLEFIDRLMKTIRDEAFKASIELAKEKGSFSKFKAGPYLSNKFIGRLPPDIQADIREYGIRNAVILSVAPTGTISMLTGCSSGIEPLFAPVYIRRFRSGGVVVERLVVDSLFQEYVEKDKSLDNFVSSHNISGDEHIKMLARVQQWIDQSISKTTNVPEDTTVKGIARYLLRYAGHVKGWTIYRSKSRAYSDLGDPMEPVDISNMSRKDLLALIKKGHTTQAAVSDCATGKCDV